MSWTEEVGFKGQLRLENYWVTTGSPLHLSDPIFKAIMDGKISCMMPWTTVRNVFKADDRLLVGSSKYTASKL